MIREHQLDLTVTDRAAEILDGRLCCCNRPSAHEVRVAAGQVRENSNVDVAARIIGKYISSNDLKFKKLSYSISDLARHDDAPMFGHFCWIV